MMNKFYLTALFIIFILALTNGGNLYAQIYPDGGHRMVVEHLDAEKTSVTSGDTAFFTVSVKLRNRTDARLTGIRLAAVLLNDKNGIIETIGTFNAGGLGAGNQYTSTIKCSVPAVTPPGKYRLMIISRHDGVAANDWRINSVSITGVSSSVDFEVIAASARASTSTQTAGSFPPAPYQPKTAIKILLNSRTTINEYTFNARGNKTVKTFYCFPPNRNAETKVLFALHGTGRNSDSVIRNFQYLAETENIIVIVPEFTTDQFPNEDYQRIGIQGNINKPENWTSKIIDDIYLDFVKRFNIPIGKYILYGHSAGAQFAHRMLMFNQSNYLDYVIAANAGVYTFISLNDVNYHPGVKDIMPVHKELLHKNFGKRLYILIGDQDNDPNHSQLPKSTAANRQGLHRYERALNFYQQSKDYCEKNKLPFNWEILVMGGVGHSSPNSRPYVIDIITGRYEK